MSVILVALKKLAGDKTPNYGAIALPGAVDRKLFAMAICFASDFVAQFQLKYDVFECLSVDKNYCASGVKSASGFVIGLG